MKDQCQTGFGRTNVRIGFDEGPVLDWILKDNVRIGFDEGPVLDWIWKDQCENWILMKDQCLNWIWKDHYRRLCCFYEWFQDYPLS